MPHLPDHLRALVVDDEQHARENLSMLLESYCPEIDVVGLADGVESAKDQIELLAPDVVFLDIRMPSGAEGFELLKQVSDRHFMVVFVTAFRDYALEAFGANALDYILKPVDPEELQAAVQKILEQSKRMQSKESDFSKYQHHLEKLLNRFSESQKQIAIHHARGIKLVQTNSILFLQAEGNCVNIVLNDNSRYLDTRTLKTYESLLPPKTFIRVHRSYLVNTAYVDELIRAERAWIKLKTGQKIPVSRSRLAKFIAAIESA